MLMDFESLSTYVPTIGELEQSNPIGFGCGPEENMEHMKDARKRKWGAIIKPHD